MRVLSRETVDVVSWAEILERAFSKEAGEESSRAKGQNEGIVVVEAL